MTRWRQHPNEEGIAERFQARLVSEGLPLAKAKASGRGWQLTGQQHLIVVLLGAAGADRRTLENLDYLVVEVPADETQWPAAMETVKSAFGKAA